MRYYIYLILEYFLWSVVIVSFNSGPFSHSIIYYLLSSSILTFLSRVPESCLHFVLCSCRFYIFVSLCLYFMSHHPPPRLHSLRHVVVEIVACLFASPPPLTPSPPLPHPWLFVQSRPPPLLQTCPSPHPPTPPPPPACLSLLRGTHSPGASPKPWRQSSPFTLPPPYPGPGSEEPACPPCSPAP